MQYLELKFCEKTPFPITSSDDAIWMSTWDVCMFFREACFNLHLCEILTLANQDLKFVTNHVNFVNSPKLLRSLYQKYQIKVTFRPVYICERNILESIYPSCRDYSHPPCESCTHSVLDNHVLYGDLNSIKSCTKLSSKMTCDEWKSPLIRSFVLECILEKMEKLFPILSCSSIILDYLSNLEDLISILNPKVKKVRKKFCFF
jgi:hypothetical protein